MDQIDVLAMKKYFHKKINKMFSVVSPLEVLDFFGQKPKQKPIKVTFMNKVYTQKI